MVERIRGCRRLMLALIAAILSACGGKAAGGIGASDDGIVRIDGSSTVFPITEAVAEEFQNANRGTRVTVGISGTGGGFQKFCRGEIDIADASRPISPGEVDACAKGSVAF